ncbi:hypothetical protein CEXT_14811 [Caerostris extrusa]|uniref:Uncharacterized protein n=1 Tax=Caerostris extrusa TaxID=172846 RepID=A0AAV4XN03_CAEEX|nr:hypothetical protein CEXT_14811 [Caerostris extrusa]
MRSHFSERTLAARSRPSFSFYEDGCPPPFKSSIHMHGNEAVSRKSKKKKEKPQAVRPRKSVTRICFTLHAPLQDDSDVGLVRLKALPKPSH